jgi:hypothetical protein
MKLHEVMPVAISITVIILVAIIQRQSKTIAAVTATMPVTIPLTLWIVYTSTQGDRSAVTQFTRGMVSGIIPTLAFTLAIWLGARAGLRLIPLIGVGYSAWGATLAVMLLIQKVSGP